MAMLKGALSDLKSFLATESPLKTMKNAFYFFLKAHFVLIFKFLSSFFGYEEKQLHYKYIVNFKICGVATWETHNCNACIDQYLKK